MKALVGYTGFVGSNIIKSHHFDALYNSKNIAEAFGTKPDLLVYSGIPAEMFLANRNPSADLAVIENAADNIRKIAPKQIVLISSIAVVSNPVGVDEDCVIDTNSLSSYGLHRYKLEQMVREIVQDCHIARLPTLFGKGIKKNFIYDMIHFFPTLLNKAKYEQFSGAEPIVASSYTVQDNGFYKLTGTSEALRAAFKRLNFSALNFTDSRSIFQFYNLVYLWNHIQIMIEHNIPLLHVAVEPLSATSVYAAILGGDFKNEVSEKPFSYDFRTKYASLFNGCNGYIFNHEKVLFDLKTFVKAEST